MTRVLPGLLAAFGAALLCAAAPAAVAVTGSAPCGLETPDRIVAIGDVHGAYDQFVSILRATSLVDTRQRWTGGGAVLVQTGDIVDRGDDARKVFDLLRRLEREAARAGGLVLPLLGNHEVMNMIGDLKDVSAKDYAAFRSPESADLRNRGHDLAAAQARKQARDQGQAFDESAFRREFFDRTPLGSVERQIAFGPRGEYGSWLRAHPVAAKINGIVFVHGGISPAVAALGCEGINRTAVAELTALAEGKPLHNAADLLVTREDGPLWYRGLALESEAQLTPVMPAILQQLTARAIVVGHTVTTSRRIAARLGGRVIQLDTGMLAGRFYPGGRASAVEIHDGIVTAVYGDGRQELTRLPALVEPGRPVMAPVR